MRVLGDRIAVRIPPAEERKGSLIIASVSDTEQVVVGVVVEVGKSVTEVQALDRVYFNRFAAFKFRSDGIDYYVLKESEVVAVA